MSTRPEDNDAEEVIGRAQGAIDSVVRRYRGRRVLDHDAAEEIASEARVTILARLRQAGGAGIHAIESYAAGLTFNLVKDLFHKRRRSREQALLPEHETIADARPPVQLAVEQRRDLDRVWQKIESLPQHHRAALLLGMRTTDGAHCAGLLVFLNVVSMDMLAAAIGVTPSELENSLWDELPLDDIRIAARLGVTPRQVISLRRSVRRSLTAWYRR